MVLAGPAVHAADRPVLAALGAVGVALLVLGVATRISDLVPAGLTLVGVEYALALLLGDGRLDQAAPLVAAGPFLPPQPGFGALRPPGGGPRPSGGGRAPGLRLQAGKKKNGKKRKTFIC